jgi:hypothetical protein
MVTSATGASTVLLDPIAQTFIIDETSFNRGVFLSSVELFFKTKPIVNIPVTISIVTTLNGFPTNRILDHSLVSLLPVDVKTSSNPQYLDTNTSTKFTFPVPVYINPATLYALIIQSNTSNYEVWVAQQNDVPIASSVKLLPTDGTPTNLSKIQKSPYIGSFFQSQNGISYTPDDTKDLMFKINRCVFNTAANPSLDFFVPSGLYFTKQIEANTFVLTNQISSNVEYDEINTSTTHYVPNGTSINYTYRTTLKRDGSLTESEKINPGEYGTPRDKNNKLNDNKGVRVLVSTVNNSFYLTATMSTGDNRVTPILSDDGLRLYTVKYSINNLSISNSDIIVSNTGSGYLSGGSGIMTGNVIISAPDLPGGTQATVAANVQSGNIVSVFVTSEGSGYSITPTISITASNTQPASVLVNGETSKTGGNAFCRYMTVPITLNEGNDSGDLKVYLTAYRPVNTDIHIYYKLLSRNDVRKFEDGYWQKMTITKGTNLFSTFDDQLYEFEASPGINGIPNNFVSYINEETGIVYNDFYKYSIKVVMSSSDSTSVPYLKDIRVIALPEGISG